MGVDYLAKPRVRFFVARDDGRVVGCGALVVKDGGRAEIKRMIVDASARGKGIGWRILEAIEGAARDAGVTRIRLETGPESREALSLYRRRRLSRARAVQRLSRQPDQHLHGKARRRLTARQPPGGSSTQTTRIVVSSVPAET